MVKGKKKTTAENTAPKRQRRPLCLVVNEDLIIAFEELMDRFRSETKAYFTYPSKAHLFETGCLFLRHSFRENDTFHKAPPAFKKYISRRGRRPSSKERSLRKADPMRMYMVLDTETITVYYDLIYSFLHERGDTGNPVYSTSYFFMDYIKLLNAGFKRLCRYEHNNPRV